MRRPWSWGAQCFLLLALILCSVSVGWAQSTFHLLAYAYPGAAAQTTEFSVDPSSFPSLQAEIVSSRVQAGFGLWDQVEEGAGGLWACDSRGRCYRVDTAAFPPTLTRLDFKTVYSFAVGAGSLWFTVARGGNKGLHRWDPKTNQEIAKIPLKGNNFVFIAEGSAWVFDGKLLSRVDPKTNQVAATISLERKSGVAGAGKPYIVPDNGSAWVLYRDGALCQIDAESGRQLVEIRVGPPLRERFADFTVDHYSGLALGEGSAWITESAEDGKVIRVDLKTKQVVATIPVGRLPQDAVVGGGFVWVSVYYTNRVGHFVLKIDPQTNQVVGKILLPSTLPALSAQEDGILAWGEAFDVGPYLGPRESYSIWKIRY